MEGRMSSTPRSGPPRFGRRSRVRFFLAFLVALGVAGTIFAYELSLFMGLSLFVPVGRAFRESATIEFTVAEGPGRLVGSWHAPTGGMIWLNPPTDSGFWMLPCIASRDWNGHANLSLSPGHYRLLISPTPPGVLIVTGTMQVIYPGDSNTTDHALFASWCGG